MGSHFFGNHPITNPFWLGWQPRLSLSFLDDAFGDPPVAGGPPLQILMLLEIMLWVLERLSQQHEIDLVIYRNSHRNFYNRLLHHVCIPIETAGFVVLVGVVATALQRQMLFPKKGNVIGDGGRILVSTVSWTLGLLSLILSPDIVGVTALLYHIQAIPWLYDRCSSWSSTPPPPLRPSPHHHHHHRHHHDHWTMLLLLLLTIASWIIQIGIGHWMLEQNQPTFFQPGNTASSTLSMLTSIVIAWKS
jgi:uncharacterized membrane protein YGL010W